MAEEPSDWDSRFRVLYHFYAYQWFDRSEDRLDIINLADADVEFFNRTADIIRGLDAQYKLAEYLQNFKIDDATANTHRRRLLAHIRQYNLTQPTRRRFYLLNVKIPDLDFIQIISRLGDGSSGVQDSPLTPVLFASDATTESSCAVRRAWEDDGLDAGVKECLEKRKVKLDEELTTLKAKDGYSR